MQGCLPCGAFARIAAAVRLHSLSCSLGRVATDSGHRLPYPEDCVIGSGGGSLSGGGRTHVPGLVLGKHAQHVLVGGGCQGFNSRAVSTRCCIDSGAWRVRWTQLRNAATGSGSQRGGGPDRDRPRGAGGGKALAGRGRSDTRDVRCEPRLRATSRRDQNRGRWVAQGRDRVGDSQSSEATKRRRQSPPLQLLSRLPRIASRLEPAQGTRDCRPLEGTDDMSQQPATKTAFVEVVGTAYDTCPAVYLFTSDTRYLFNCGEGLQRYVFGLAGTKPAKVRNVFLTGAHWEAMGGTIGMCLSLCAALPAEGGDRNVSVWGPRGIREVKDAATKTFLKFGSAVSAAFREVHQDGVMFENRDVVIAFHSVSPDVASSIPVESTSSCAPRQGGLDTISSSHAKGDGEDDEDDDDGHCHGHGHGHGHCGASASKRARTTHEGHVTSGGAADMQMDDVLASASPRRTAGCYVVNVKSPARNVDMDRVRAMNIPEVREGRVLARLKKEENVKLTSGRVVTPDEVLGPKLSKFCFAVVGCPDMTYVPSLSRLHLGADTTVVYHTAPADVVATPAYRKWMHSAASPAATHVMLNNAMCAPTLAYVDAGNLQHHLHAVQPDIFPLPFASMDNDGNGNGDGNGDGGGGGGGVTPLHTLEGCVAGTLGMRTYAFEGKHCVPRDGPVQPRAGEAVEEARKMPGLIDACKGFPSLVVSSKDEETIGEGEEAAAAATAPSAVAPLISPHTDEGMNVDGDAAIVFLGTCSAVPGKYRNVSGILLCVGVEGAAQGVEQRGGSGSMETDDRRSSSGRIGVDTRECRGDDGESEPFNPSWIAVLDAGEGTLGSMFRQFGHALPDALRATRIVFISHMHADHHLGLVRLLIAREHATRDTGEEPVVVVGPANLRKWLVRYSAVGTPLSFRFVDCRDVAFGRRNEVVQAELARGGMTGMTTVCVTHCRDAYGVVFERSSRSADGSARGGGRGSSVDAAGAGRVDVSASAAAGAANAGSHDAGGFKVVYSGDCRPTHALVEAGRGATVLVHDSTFDDDLADQAVDKLHSTISEALSVGAAMEAKYTVLTHFSARKQKEMPRYADGAAAAGGVTKTIVAFDGMRLRFRDLGVASRVNAAVSTMLDNFHFDDVVP